MAKIIMNESLRLKIDELISLTEATLDLDNRDELNEKYSKLKNSKFVDLEDLKDLKEAFKARGKPVYIHELVQSSELYLPKYEPSPRNPELEARVQMLKVKYEEEDYQEMVKNVDLNSKLRYRNAYKAKFNTTDFRTTQGQLIAIVNMLIVICGAFAFGYKSVEYALQEPNYLLQIAAGFFLALIVAVADIYFLIKKLLKVEKLEQAATTATSQQRNSKKQKPTETSEASIEKNPSEKKNE